MLAAFMGFVPVSGESLRHNASSPEDTIGLQIMHVKGPIARTVQDLRLSLAAMSGADFTRSVVGAGALWKVHPCRCVPHCAYDPEG